MNSNVSALAAQVAQSLLDIEAVVLRPNEPFTWTSGMKSPIYCDNRLTLSYPAIRNQIAEGFASIIREKYPEAEVLAGIATGGIAHAAFAAEKLGLPMIYVRDKAKGHGKQNMIEGVLKPGQKVVMIEDLISTGGSSLKAALAVREAGAEVLATLAIFTYEFEQSVRAFAEAGIPLHTVTNYTKLTEAALESGRIGEEEMALLKAWRSDPAAYGARFA
ncbi:orotate phosphoribosyltransferase [Paenibacillus thermoaerophilus]|jgi:orotate phosphoribosyltransferase|uniref:Orotate phosphoribosyltransferase n=1 Tax=Paenibacillus thermoaerophilus TaxID=1215385 RepID=A0ABW2UXY2_9BACL|nr:orotate phosphoribosyltransferase [Paenibacillus thermoaerophilus]TMV19110.1 orotate phosphoribosyltransferase [Paenibacillus thermoaerophilus]